MRARDDPATGHAPDGQARVRQSSDPPAHQVDGGMTPAYNSCSWWIADPHARHST